MPFSPRPTIVCLSVCLSARLYPTVGGCRATTPYSCPRQATVVKPQRLRFLVLCSLSTSLHPTRDFPGKIMGSLSRSPRTRITSQLSTSPWNQSGSSAAVRDHHWYITTSLHSSSPLTILRCDLAPISRNNPNRLSVTELSLTPFHLRGSAICPMVIRPGPYLLSPIESSP